jgi:dihydrofolate reductase
MISLLVAMDQKRTIGKDNDLPWHLPADLAFFKRVTMGHPIVMGRKTHESIGRALPGRTNIIVTRDKNYSAQDCKVIHSIEEIKNIEENKEDEVFVIGGAEIFNKAVHFADRLYITLIEETFAGDTFFPEIIEAEWELVSKEKGIKDEKNPYDYFFLLYKRK